MHSFALVDLAGVAIIGWVLVKVLGPVARAIATRIGGGASTTTAADPAVPQIQGELEQLQERVDFLERALAARQPPAERLLAQKPESRQVSPER